MRQVENLPDKDAIKEIVQAIFECWQQKDYDGIGAYVAEDVVVAPPKSDARPMGRAVFIQSYRDYDQVAKTTDYKAGDPRVDVIADTAVAVCPFEVVYELKGVVHHEMGENILVFRKARDRWELIWRTMHAEEMDHSSL